MDREYKMGNKVDLNESPYVISNELIYQNSSISFLFHDDSNTKAGMWSPE